MNNGLILVVDDEPQNLAAMRQVLSNKYQTIFARSGAEALTVAHKHVPSLILLDIQMPDMDGYTVCQQLKSSPYTQDIPVIFISAYSEIGHEAKGFSVGAVDYITKPISPAIVCARVRTHLSLVQVTRLEQSYREAIFMLGEAGHYNDTDTGVHIWRMAAFAGKLAEACGWNQEQCKLLESAAPMHDTGKIGIPNAILRKPGKLDSEEWETMKTHTRIGHDILSRSDAPVFKMASEIALHHHEKWDGSGYPAGLSGDSIPESARIVALADVFDALTMKRPYKEAWPVDQVLSAILKGAGNHFEPGLVKAFTSILPDILEIKGNWDAGERLRMAA